MSTVIAFVWNKKDYKITQETNLKNSGSETLITTPNIPFINESSLFNLTTTLVVNTNYFSDTDNNTIIQETYSFETFQATQSIGNLFIIVSYKQKINPENLTTTNIPSLIGYVSSKGIYTEWNNTIGTIFFNNTTGERKLQLIQ